MPQQNRTILKTYFESGDTPTAEQFQNLIDSFLNKKDDGINVVDNNKIGLGTVTPKSKLDIAGGLSIGQNYAGNEAAPLNGLLVEGNTGLGITQPVNKLDVSGGLSIGTGYAGVVKAPENGLLIEGKVGIGTNNPLNKLDVSGGLSIGAGYAGVANAPENGLLIEGKVGIGVTDPQEPLTVKGSIGIEELSDHQHTYFGKIYAKESSLNSLHFNGSSDYIDLSDHVQAFAKLTTGTISFWYHASLEEFKPANLLWFGNKAQTTTNDFAVFIGQNSYDDDCLMTHIYSGSGNPNPDLQMFARRGKNYFKDEKWHHVAITYGKGANRIYLDGEESQTFHAGDINTENSFFNLPDNANGFIISYRIYNKNFELPLAGSLDEFAILNRPLGESEISRIFRNGRTYNLIPPYGENLMGYWKMDDRDEEGMIRDHSGNDFHGIAMGTTMQTSKIKGLYYKDSDGVVTALTGEEVSGQLSSVWDKIGPNITYMDGNVGIGTDEPGRELSVNGIMKISRPGGEDRWTKDNWSKGIELENGNCIQFLKGGTGNSVGIGGNLGTMYFGRSPADDNSAVMKHSMVIDPDGSVGIGTTEPAGKLHVNGKAALERILILTIPDSIGTTLDVLEANTGKGGAIFSTDTGISGSDHAFGFRTSDDNASTKMVIQSNGNVGIGTPTPYDKLELKFTSSDGNRGFAVTDENGAQANVVPTGLGVNGSYAHFGYNIQASSDSQLIHRGGDNYSSGISFGGSIQLWTQDWASGGTEFTPDPALTIAQGGNVGIGTTDPIATFDTTSGISKKINKFLTILTVDYQHHYVKLFKILPADNNNAITLSGRVSAYRINDLGISISSEIHISHGYHRSLTFSQIAQARNFELVKLSDGGTDYVALYAPYSAPGIYAWHLDLQVYNSGGASNLLLEEHSSPALAHASLSYSEESIYMIGNVGIGTTSPSYKLDVNGYIRSRGNAILGSDYAEYFKSKTGKSIPKGTSVVLEKGLIRPAKKEEIPLGIISANPGIIGGVHAEWPKKYLRDDFGDLIMEAYKEEIMVPKTEKVKKEGQRKKVEVPVLDENGHPVMVGTGKFETKTRPKLNPKYNPKKEYTPREDRPEWNCVGLLGQLPLRKGQPVAPSWVKIKDISKDVELWLVK